MTSLATAPTSAWASCHAQIGDDSAIWLDRELVSGQRVVLADDRFGREVKMALEKRKQTLVSMGHVTDLGGGHVRAPKGLIQRLEATAIERAGKALAAQRGLTTTVPGSPSLALYGNHKAP